MRRRQSRLWILNHYAKPAKEAGGTRHFALAKYLQEYGWSTCVVAASYDHFSGGQRLRSGETYRMDRHAGVDFLWLKTPSYSGSQLGRMVNMACYSLAALQPEVLPLAGRPDAIIGSSVHPFAGLSALVLARRLNVPFLFEVRDLWPLTLIELGRIRPESTASIVLGQLERLLYREATDIISLLPRAVDYIRQFGIPVQRVTWIPNGVDISEFTYRQTPPVRDDFVFMYFGAMGQANSLNILLDAFGRFQRMHSDFRRVRLRLIGDGTHKSELIERGHSLGLSGVTFEPAVPKEEVPRLASEADAFVVTALPRARLYRFGISFNKLFDYLAAGRPIVAAMDVPCNPVLEAEAGIVVHPEDEIAMAEALAEVVRLSPEARRKMGERGREYVSQTNDYRVLAERLAGVLDHATKSRITG